MSRGVEAVRPGIRAMAGYVPGKQPAPGTRVIKLNTNESPLPPSPRVAEAIGERLADPDALRRYPVPDSSGLRRAAAEIFGCRPENVIAGNGSDELLRIILDTFVDDGEEIAYFHPSYSLYPVLAEIRGAKSRALPLFDGQGGLYLPDLAGVKLFFLTSPNAPLGFSFDNGYIRKLAAACGGVVVVDEAYADFALGNALELVGELDNLIVLRTLSKSYGLDGLRVGLGAAPAEIIAELDKVRDSYNLDHLAQVGAVAALEDRDYLRKTVALVRTEREFLTAGLEGLGFKVEPSQTNFVFATPPAPARAQELYEKLAARGILVRWFADPILEQGLRITIGNRPEMEAVLAAVKEIMDQ
ncbi:MAG: histidinol-phosphate transaminase [Deltaproteobacteria bacterium]|nr:histidinol-phosphate transaminase [Deltaproteobacteria bacterium]